MTEEMVTVPRTLFRDMADALFRGKVAGLLGEQALIYLASPPGSAVDDGVGIAPVAEEVPLDLKHCWCWMPTRGADQDIQNLDAGPGALAAITMFVIAWDDGSIWIDGYVGASKQGLVLEQGWATLVEFPRVVL